MIVSINRDLLVLETGVASAVKTLGMTIRIEVREGEPLAKALQRLKCKVRYAGVLYHAKYYREYTKACEVRRLKKGKAKRRAQGFISGFERAIIAQRERDLKLLYD